MSAILGFGREAIRIKKYEGSQTPDYRKFSVDPQITSFEVLQSILSKAFDLKCDFTISYSMHDVQGNEIYMPLLSDWELDAAFLKAHNLSLSSSSEPCLSLRVDLKPFEECSDDWEVRNNVPVITQLRTGTAQEAKPSPRFHGIINQMGRTLNMVQRALNFGDDVSTSLQPPRAPLSDSEFRRFLDPVGQVIHTKELKSVIYLGGVDPSLRKVVWKHLLNVYPEGMTGRERMDYIKKLANEYNNLKDTWKKALANGNISGELAYTTGMVRKDVLRTDRHHPFYSGNDDNQNVTSLFNILTTFALNHPKVSYCQGMSDLASPLLVTMGNEANAYICFCALMSRLCSNFMLDGIAMTQKFTHLAEGIMYYDPDFYNYLKVHQADDLLFCYRWLLLEMKREFAFEDSLRMLEVLWSSLPANPPAKELKLYDVIFQIPLNPPKTPPISPLIKTPRENAYTKICALRRQSSSISLNSYPTKSVPIPRQNHSLDESLGRFIKSNSDFFSNKNQSLDDSHLINEENKEQVIQAERSPPLVNIIEKPGEFFEDECKVSMKNVVLTQNCKCNHLSASMSNIMSLSKKTPHFKNLKERLVANKMNMYSSLEALDGKELSCKHQQRIVKNLNEFSLFGSVNQNKINLNILEDYSKHKQVSPLKSNPTPISAPVSNHDTSEDNSPEDTKDNCFSDPEGAIHSRVTYLKSKQRFRNEKENISKNVKYFLDKFEKFKEKNSKDPDSIARSLDQNSDTERLKEKLTDGTHAQNNFLSSRNIEMQSNSLQNKNSKKKDEIFIWENPLPEKSPSSVFKHLKDNLDLDKIASTSNASSNDIVNKLLNVGPKNSDELANSCEEITEINKHSQPPGLLPPPNEFGGGNPFLMFLCLTVLLQHREHIMSKEMDYNEMAMHFDKMVRKHNVNKVLNQARQMYAGYLKQHTMAQILYKTRDEGGGDKITEK